MILHLVRHPPPRVAAGVCYGRLDVAAEAVAETAAALRAALPPGLPVWSSPLRRCRELAEALHPTPLLDERLAEMNFGEWEGKTWEAVGAAALDDWSADIAGFVPPGGESARDMQRRALDFVAGLDVPEAVLVTHSGVIRVLLAHWRGVSPAEWTSLVFPHGSLTTVTVSR